MNETEKNHITAHETEIAKLYYLAQIPVAEREQFLKDISIQDISTEDLQYRVKLWTDEQFYLSEVERITEALIKSGNLKLLLSWQEYLKDIENYYDERIAQVERKLAELEEVNSDEPI